MHNLKCDRIRVPVVEDDDPICATRCPKRWIVERTFGWLNRFRRLSKDYELYTDMNTEMIYGSLIRLMTRRLIA